MADWGNFLIAEIGAAGALTGLIFVAVSINIAKIVAAPTLADRALVALLLFLTVLVVCSLLIAPNESPRTGGIAVLVIGVLLWAFAFRVDRRILRAIEPEYRRHMQVSFVFNQVTILLYVATGIALLVQGADGMRWLVPATLFSFCKGLFDAWVLLVEINR